MDYRETLRVGGQIARDCSCFEVHFPAIASAAYGARLRQSEFYRRLRWIHHMVAAELEIHHGSCARAETYREPDDLMPNPEGGDPLNLAVQYLVLRIKRQSHDWLVLIENHDCADKNHTYLQTNGTVIARLVANDAPFDPKLADTHNDTTGFIYKGSLRFGEEPFDAPSCEVPNVMFGDRAKYFCWLQNDIEHIEAVLQESAAERK